MLSETPSEVRSIFGGFHVKTITSERGEPFCVHVSKMLVNWRLALWEGECDSTFSSSIYYWCFAGTTLKTLHKVMAEAILWKGDPLNPPEGWVKSYTGEYREELGRLGDIGTKQYRTSRT